MFIFDERRRIFLIVQIIYLRYWIKCSVSIRTKITHTISDINYYTRDKILYLLLLKIRGTKEFVVELSNIRKSFSIFICSPMNKTKSSAINIHRKIVRNRSPKRPKCFFKLSTASNQRILLQKRIFATFPSVFHR